VTGWIILAAMLAVAAAGIAIPLVRRRPATRPAPAEAAVLEAQLAQIDRQASAEQLPADLAEGLKTEAIRRFLAEAPPEAGAAPAAPRLAGRGALILAGGLAVLVAAGGVGLYSLVGRPDLAAGGQPARAAPPSPAGEGAELIARLEARLRESPTDPQGWKLLAWSYGQVGRFAEAAAAYGRAAALEPDSADDPSAQGEALVRAAGGQVTPAALTAFAAALRIDPADPRARYFKAAAKDQAGDRAGAMADWIALLKSAPPGAPWAREVRGFILRVAAARGLDISARLPPAGAAATPAGPGPTPDQAAAARRMAPTDRQAMIQSMVDRLAARLKANPRDIEGWIVLMRSRMVLGDGAGAASAYRDAVKTFADGQGERTRLAQAARALRVPGV
jgi:cytochrome c-type biogenesis protein CcmH